MKSTRQVDRVHCRPSVWWRRRRRRLSRPASISCPSSGRPECNLNYRGRRQEDRIHIFPQSTAGPTNSFWFAFTLQKLDEAKLAKFSSLSRSFFLSFSGSVSIFVALFISSRAAIKSLSLIGHLLIVFLFYHLEKVKKPTILENGQKCKQLHNDKLKISSSLLADLSLC